MNYAYWITVAALLGILTAIVWAPSPKPYKPSVECLGGYLWLNAYGEYQQILPPTACKE